MQSSVDGQLFNAVESSDMAGVDAALARGANVNATLFRVCPQCAIVVDRWHWLTTVLISQRGLQCTWRVIGVMQQLWTS